MRSPRMNMVDALSLEKRCTHCGELEAWVDQQPCSQCGEAMCSDCCAADMMMACPVKARCGAGPCCAQPDAELSEEMPSGIWPVGASNHLLGCGASAAAEGASLHPPGWGSGPAARVRGSSTPRRMRSWIAHGVIGVAMLAAVEAASGGRSV